MWRKSHSVEHSAFARARGARARVAFAARFRHTPNIFKSCSAGCARFGVADRQLARQAQKCACARGVELTGC
jgi:hypothetical protein